jgi:hypothetical protein
VPTWITSSPFLTVCLSPSKMKTNIFKVIFAYLLSLTCRGQRAGELVINPTGLSAYYCAGRRIACPSLFLSLTLLLTWPVDSIRLGFRHFGQSDECHVDFRNVIFYNTLWKIHRLTIQYSFIRSLMIGCGDPENTALDLT